MSQTKNPLRSHVSSHRCRLGPADPSKKLTPLESMVLDETRRKKGEQEMPPLEPFIGGTLVRNWEPVAPFLPGDLISPPQLRKAIQ